MTNYQASLSANVAVMATDTFYVTACFLCYYTKRIQFKVSPRRNQYSSLHVFKEDSLEGYQRYQLLSVYFRNIPQHCYHAAEGNFLGILLILEHILSSTLPSDYKEYPPYVMDLSCNT